MKRVVKNLWYSEICSFGKLAFRFFFGFDFIVSELSADCPRASLTQNFKFKFASPKRWQTQAFGCKILAFRNFAFRLHFVSELSPGCARASSNPMRPWASWRHDQRVWASSSICTPLIELLVNPQTQTRSLRNFNAILNEILQRRPHPFWNRWRPFCRSLKLIHIRT